MLGTIGESTSQYHWLIYVRRIFSGLSEFAHSRPNYNDSHFRESNGPIYVKSAFNHVAWIHFETIAVAYVLAIIARPKMRVSPATIRA
jgi:hypothetical protein